MPRTPQIQPGAAGRRRFRPRWWSTILTIAGCALFVALGIWQIDRGEQKAHLDTQLAASRHAHPLNLEGDRQASPPPTPQVRAVVAHGRYLSSRQLLMADQSEGNRVGYDVLTPLRLADGDLLIVNRGWVPAPRKENVLPPVGVGEKPRDVRGLWRRLPAPGLRLNAHNCRKQAWPRVVSYPTRTDLRCLYGPHVRPGELLLAASLPDGFVRRWRIRNGFSPLRHYSYAAQWFGFAALALFLFFRLNFKIVPQPATGPDKTHDTGSR